MDTIAIKKMSTIERIQTMEAIWDSLLYEDGEIDTPAWHEKIIEERKKRSKMVKQNLSL
ncbi:MAG: addiction module protein [Candidatus Cloacimonadota bacterium]|nr:addiction module protein [Thermodesulfobacteriota bacterium]MEA2104665.1 addiction module protein [Candidatus Cloacimonadota bacterium]